MLYNLKISNFAIIDNIDITFDKGFSVLTGETGAGKSIILGALGLLTGSRFDDKSALKPGKKTVIEAQFNVTGYPLLKDIFAENDLDFDEEQCIIRREISPEGKTRIFINDTPTTLAIVKGITIQLIDIHSQHANTLLSDNKYQLYLLDVLADNSSIRNEYLELYSQYTSKKAELSLLKKKIEDSEKELDYNRFLYNQLYDLNLQSGEEELLEEAHMKLSNVQQIKETLWNVLQNLESENTSLPAVIATAAHKMDSLGSMLHDASSYASRLESVSIDLHDIIESIEKENEEIVDDPRELERIEERLAAIFDLKRKHQVSSVEELLKIQEELDIKINLAENSQFEIDGLRKEILDLKRELKRLADLITESRTNAANIFEESLSDLARPLGLRNIRCRFAFSVTDFTNTGCDSVDLQVAINKNQEFSSIAATASGGELSRIMLCVKYLLAQKMSLPTVIFDEIDTGVSGDIAARMAELMKKMSEYMQVIAITHLPQVAAKGVSHYKVYKSDTEDSTVSTIVKLDYDERVMELAAMLGDSKIGDAAISNAKSLLESSK